MRCILMLCLNLSFFGAFAQGKFYGGDAPNSYSGSSVMIQILPVSYAWLQAKADGGHIELSWLSVTEINNDYFEIHKLNDLDEFTAIGRINGRGTSTTPHHYQWMDLSPDRGINYYRVRQVDTDGESSTSKIFSAHFLQQEITIFPNPVRNELHLNAALRSVPIHIYSIDGKLQKSSMLNSSTINVSNLLSGEYILRFDLGGKVITERFSKK